MHVKFLVFDFFTSVASQELPLEQRLLLLLACELFYIFFFKESFLFPRVLLLWAFFFVCVRRACCRRAFTATKAQQGAIIPAQSSKASTCRPQRDNTSKQTELARASSMSSSIIQLAAFLNVLKTT